MVSIGVPSCPILAEWCPFVSHLVSHLDKMVSHFVSHPGKMVSHPGRIVSHVVSLRVPTCPVGLSDCGTMPCLRLSWYPLYRGRVSFAKASRGGDKCQLAARREPCIQSLDQPRARDQLGPDGWNIQFCLQERILLHDRPSHSETKPPPCKYIMSQMGCQRGCSSAEARSHSRATMPNLATGPGLRAPP